MLNLRLTRAVGATADESGAALVWVVVFLPVLFLFASFAVDTANWWEHRRHLQTQADAAALAGGMEFAYPCDDAIATSVEAVARNYGGPHNGFPTAQYNPQIGGTPADKLYLLVNSADFWNEGGTNYSDGGRPCIETNFLDVKITETDVPFFFPLVDDFVPAINARARVAIEKIGSIGGEQLLPLFVRDVNPNSVAALFISENADGSETLLDAEYMQKASSCDSGFACWNNAAEPADVLIPQTDQRTSLVIAVSSYEPCTTSPTPCFAVDPTMTAQEICFQEGAECYWADDTTVRAGIVYIQAYSTSGGGPPPSQPAIRSVTLGPGSASACPDGSFAFTEAPCKIRVFATIDMGTFESTGNARITVHGAGCPNAGCQLTYNSGSGSWEGDVEIPAVGNNPDVFTPTIPLEVRWVYRQVTMGDPGVACANTFNNPPSGCHGTFGTVQRSFSGSDPFSGPIRSATVVHAGSFLSAHSVPISGMPYQLVANIKLAGSVATDTDDPPIRLRVATNQGAVNCDPVIEVTREEITRGCSPTYTFNNRTGQADPCDPPFNAANGTPPSAPDDVVYPPNTVAGLDCVRTDLGTTPNEIAAGMIGRIFNNRIPVTPGNARTVNNCPSSGPGGGFNNWTTLFPSFSDDPRVVVLFMVPFGAFRDSGQDLYPITNFGAFYVTDWWGQSGGGLDDACGTDGDGPAGWISGHFINYRLPSNTTGSSGEECDPGDFTPCVVVLTD